MTGLARHAYWCNSGTRHGSKQPLSIGFKSCSKQATLLNQEPMARELIGPRRVPTIIILLTSSEL